MDRSHSNIISINRVNRSTKLIDAEDRLVGTDRRMVCVDVDVAALRHTPSGFLLVVV
jgi:hypothetical protein